MLSHVTYLHDFLDRYVLCYGSDGHIAIENLDDCTDCENISSSHYFTNGFSPVIQENNCNDLSINSNCFEDAQFLLKTTNVFELNKNVHIKLVYNPPLEIEFAKIEICQKSYNPILDNYTTVSLLI